MRRVYGIILILFLLAGAARTLAQDQPTPTPDINALVAQAQKAAADAQKAALLFASFVTTPEVAQRHIGEFGAPSSVAGVLPPEDHPITTQMAKWLQGEVQLYLPTDQAVPQEIVNAFFQAQDSVVLGTITPEAAAAQIQKAVEAYKAAHK